MIRKPLTLKEDGEASDENSMKFSEATKVELDKNLRTSIAGASSDGVPPSKSA